MIKIIPLNKKDTKVAKLMEKVIEQEMDTTYLDLIASVVDTRAALESVYGTKTSDLIWDNLVGRLIAWHVNQRSHSFKD